MTEHPRDDDTTDTPETPERTQTPAAADLSGLPLFAVPNEPTSATDTTGTSAAMGGHRRTPADHLAGRLAGSPPTDDTTEAPAQPPAPTQHDDDSSSRDAQSTGRRALRPLPATPETSAGGPASASDDIDWALVRGLHQTVAEQLVQRESFQGRIEDPAARRELGRKMILDVLSDYARDADNSGVGQISAAHQERMAKAIYDEQFGLGRLQPLVDDDDLEDIEIYGYDNVVLISADGGVRPGPPIAESDSDLIETIQRFASNTADSTSRPWTAAHPDLDLTLPGDHRLAASAWITPRPTISIRRHRLVDVTLDDLVARNTLDPTMASLLRAAVVARMSVVVSGDMGAGKALALDTPIPTPHGWTTMRDLRRGDEVFTESGAVCSVLEAHPVQHQRPCFEVEFDDGEVITADADHLWSVTRNVDRVAHQRGTAKTPGYRVNHVERARLRRLGEQCASEPDEDLTFGQLLELVGADHRQALRTATQTSGPTGHVRAQTRGRWGTQMMDCRTYSKHKVVQSLVDHRGRPTAQSLPSDGTPVILTTAEIGENTWVAKDKPWLGFNHAITIAGPLQYPTQEQPIDPYVLGIWLGDGATSCARVSTADPEILTALEQAGYPSTKVPRSKYDYQVHGGLHARLNHLGVLGDKHIPRLYLHGDADQRMQLLQGLMDSDGTVVRRSVKGTRTPQAGSSEFSNSNPLLAKQVHELALGLGLKAHLRSKVATLAGRECGITYTVSFTTNRATFSLPRKRDLQATCSAGPQARKIVAVRPTTSVPVRCITVDAPSSLYLAGRSCVPTHNTTMVRALANEIPPWESLGTIESERELFLHKLTDRHPRCISWEARPGSGEVGADGRQIGQVTMDDILVRAMRMNRNRVIVGEVRGPEIIPMFQAMQAGAGSLSTTHAHSAKATIGRLVAAAMQAGSSVTSDWAYREVHSHIKLIVHVQKVEGVDPKTGEPRVRDRYVDEVLALAEGSDGQTPGSATEVYRRAVDGHAQAHVLPEDLVRLSEFGFDINAFRAQVQSNGGGDY